MSYDLVNELGAALREGKVKITYRKKDGTETTRTASLNDDVIKSTGYVFKESTSSTRKVNPSQFIYFELESNQFKSFIKDSLISFEKVK